MERLRIGVVGATGAVGEVFLRLLEERNFPVHELRLFASPRSAGKRLRVFGEEWTVREVGPDAFQGLDIVFISADSSVSKALAPRAVEAGAVAIDDSSAFRMDPQVPLVVPEINASDLEGHRGIVAIPNCSTTALVMALYPIHRVNRLRRVVVDTYQSVSGTGRRAMEELREQTRAVLAGREYPPQVYPYPIAFNLIPQIDDFREDGYTKEEWKMVAETRKILHEPDLAISATCVRVPVFVGHSEAVHLELERPMEPEEAREVLSAFPGVKVVDDPARRLYPTPLQGAGVDEVLVGRIRKDASHPNGLALWLVSDNLRKGAGLNALQIAEELVRRDLLRRR